MNENRMETWRQSLARLPSRRDVLRGIASAGLGLGVVRWQEAAEAKKKHNKKGQKPNKGKNERKQKAPMPVFNQFGGRAPRGFNLTMAATNGGGTVYFTTNGGD